MSKLKPHERVNDILLGPLERPALQWLAARMPKFVTPDHLTAIGVLAAIIILLGYYLTNIDPAFLWLANFGFVLNWFGDSLDGTLARFRKIERPKYGFFIDHTVDSFNELLIGVGLGLSPLVRFEFAMLALIGYLLMSVFVYIKTYVRGVFQISYSKFGPTEVRVIIIVINTIIFFFGNPIVFEIDGGISAFDILTLAIALILFIVFIVSTLTEARNLNKIESSN